MCQYCIGCLPAVTLANPDPFAELDAAIQQLNDEGSDKEIAEFQKWKANHLAEFSKFRQEYFQQPDAFRDNLIATWGESEISTQSKFVQYSDDLSSKTVVN